MALLLDNASATGSEQYIGPGYYGFTAVGTFDGATVTLEREGPDYATWISCGAEVALTSNGFATLMLPGGKYRVSVSGGTAPSGLYAELSRIDI